jgi:hypothetical protein
VYKLIVNVLRFAGRPHHLCQWIANLQNNSAKCALTCAIRVLGNVTDITLITVRDVQKHVAPVPKNVEGWPDKQ